MHVFASLAEWAEAIRADLRAAEFHVVATVGFTRFGSYAGARSHADCVVFADAEEEYAALRATPIECLSVDPYLRDTLARLGITRLGGFMDLPRDAIRKRFGADAEALHEMAAGMHWRPMQPREFVEPIERVVTLEYPENNADRLLFLVARELSVMLAALAERHEALQALHIIFELGDGNEQRCQLLPASPTLDARQILTLLRLRLERMTLTAGVDELRLCAEGVAASQRQLELFNDAAGRNLDAANEAIAKLRAFLDQEAIVRARLREGHLPEAQFQWEPARRLRAPQPAEGRAPALAKRIY
jgi:protein ImuB